MNAPAPLPRGRLRHYLLRWTLGTLALAWLVLVAQAWSTGYREARQFSDAQLVAVANLWTTALPQGTSGIHARAAPPVDHEYVHDIAVMAWRDGALVTDTHGLTGRVQASALPDNGFATLDVIGDGGQGGRPWRAFGVSAPDTQRVVVLMDMRQRHELGNDLALHVAEPALLVLPLIGVLVWWAVRRGLRPLEQLSREVAALDAFAGQRLDNSHRFAEFASTVHAINTLVDTLQSRARREREFASDVAHELRTPLAALTLQAQAARHAPTDAQLQRLSDEALRAGDILAQLLDLARAQRTLSDAQDQPCTDLVEVATAQVAAHAPLADQAGHELSLKAPAAPLEVPAAPGLLSLALRNLIDNAVRHTPTGSQVVVQVGRDARGIVLAVSDDGLRGGAPPVPPGEGLGLGLRLVQRMAEQMGATLERDVGEPPMTTRFLLRWPPGGCGPGVA